MVYRCNQACLSSIRVFLDINMKYSVFIKIVFFWCIWLPVACSGPTPIPIPEITIFTSALGKDGDKFPV